MSVRDRVRRCCVTVMVLLVALPPASGLAQQATVQGAAKLLDVMRVSAAGDAGQAVITPKAGPVEDVACDVVIVGAGLGGVSAALAAATGAHHICMTEPTLWVGGQATSQGVSAFDDNQYIDTTGGSATYLDLSNRIRRYYAGARRETAMPVAQAIQGPLSNPGSCWVSRLCFEPAPAQQILRGMLQPLLQKRQLRLWLHTVPVRVERNGRTLTAVVVYDFGHDRWVRLHGRFFVEASELGDLIAISGLPFRKGAEAQAETHERNAPLTADPRASQSFTYPFILEKHAQAQGPYEKKPVAYDSFLPLYTLTVDYGHGKLLTYGFFAARPGLPGSFWVYRRSVDASLFRPSVYPDDRSMINWSSNDHCDANLLGSDPLLQAHALQDAKRASLGFAWWLRHAVPRDDQQGVGYPELTVIANAMGSDDGLSQHPYIRESRRIVPLRTIVEEDLAIAFQPGARAALYPDTVGIGWYPIDIHSCDRQDFVSKTKPYEIPLGALIDRDADNLMAVGKTIGTTHITNGAYRLHPTEWATGEAAGAALSWSLTHHTNPTEIDRDPQQIQGLQRELVLRGQPIFWFDDIPVNLAGFAAMQIGATRGWWVVDPATLHGGADDLVDGRSVAKALAGQIKPADAAALQGKTSLRWEDLRPAGLNVGKFSGEMRRLDFARWMMERAH